MTRKFFSTILLTLAILAQRNICQIFPFELNTSFINITEQSNIFYWLFEPQNAPKESAPVVIFMDGGPGCSTTYSLFDFIGPLYVENYQYDPQTQTYTGNKQASVRTSAWNDQAYLLIIDQPVGVGFSRAGTYSDLAKNATDIRDNFSLFLNAFFDRYQNLQGRDLFITGHSYAGHYIPYTVTKLLESGFNKAIIKGVSIGNPYMNGKIMFQSYPTFAAQNQQYTNISPADAATTTNISQLCGHLYSLPQNYLYMIPTLQICQEVGGMLAHLLPQNFDVNYMPSNWKYNNSYEVFLNDQDV
jgi:carboxypeptidase C (cathepsin A)